MPELTGDKFISSGAADRLLAAHDGDVALLYLYLRRHGAFDAEDAARLLCRTRGEIDAAWEKLRRMGLTDLPAADAPAVSAAPVKLPPAEELPEYKAEELVRRSREDPAFSALVGEAQRVLGRGLSSTELKRLPLGQPGDPDPGAGGGIHRRQPPPGGADRADRLCAGADRAGADDHGAKLHHRMARHGL